MTKTVLSLAVALMRVSDNRMLTVRKRGTTFFMQPGGKIDPGETAAEALCRELKEELSISVTETELDYVGQAGAVAANEPNTEVIAEIFELTRRCWGAFELTAEIEETKWVKAGDDVSLAPLTKDEILPRLEA